MGYQALCPTLLYVERIVIQELERTLRLTRADTISYTDVGLLQIAKLLESALLAITLETYSRQSDAAKVIQAELV